MPTNSHLTKVRCACAMTLKLSLYIWSRNVSYGPKYRPRKPHSNGDIGPRKTQKIGFSPKWRRKLLPVPVFTSYSDSPWSNWSITPQISKTTPLHFFDKFDLKAEKFKKYLNELQRSQRVGTYNRLQPLWPSTTVPKYVKIVR